MSLFQFTTDKIKVTKELIELGPFREIAERENSDSLFAYIFHMKDWSSPYNRGGYTEEEKVETLNREFLDGKEPDKVLLEALNLYEELSQTQSLKLLKSARTAVRKLQEYFEEADPSNEEDSNKAAKDLIANLSKVGSLLKNIEEWEEIVKKEEDTADTRKGVKLNKYNR